MDSRRDSDFARGTDVVHHRSFYDGTSWREFIRRVFDGVLESGYEMAAVLFGRASRDNRRLLFFSVVVCARCCCRLGCVALVSRHGSPVGARPTPLWKGRMNADPTASVEEASRAMKRHLYGNLRYRMLSPVLHPLLGFCYGVYARLFRRGRDEYDQDGS